MQSRAYELCGCGKMQRWIVEFRDWALAEAQFPKRALPIPATFVVGRDGLIIDRFVDPDFRDRMEIEDILKALSKARQ